MFDAVSQQIAHELGDLLDRLVGIIGQDEAVDVLQTRIEARGRLLAGQLLGEDEKLDGQTVIDLANALFPAGEPPVGWWRTPLGRAVATSVGHPSAEAVPHSVAGAMLGITRQGVGDLVARHKLDRHPDGGVAVASIRARLRDAGATAS
jgi:hypothetical protein